MQIAHEEARRLIQFNLDEVLSVDKNLALSAHLKDCSDCQAYAEQLQHVDRMLTPLLKRQWSVQPIPLRVSELLAKRDLNRSVKPILTMRKALLVSMVFAAFLFSTWQFMLSGTGSSEPLPLGVPPAPTPSLQLTSTESLLKSCIILRYAVQENDTLDSISRQFSVTREEIMAHNHLESPAIHGAKELNIPLCSFTPTGIADGSATFTMTYTPILSPITSTPGGRY